MLRPRKVTPNPFSVVKPAEALMVLISLSYPSRALLSVPVKPVPTASKWPTGLSYCQSARTKAARFLTSKLQVAEVGVAVSGIPEAVVPEVSPVAEPVNLS